MKQRIWVFTLALTAALLASTSLAKPAFLFDATPSPSDWKSFHGLPFHKQKEIWDQASRQGKSFKDWAWEWRIGWTRACAKVKDQWCDDLLQAALFDEALVVRTEAATRLGERFVDTRDINIVKLLERAWKDPRNLRNGERLFIGQRILFALRKIGGDQALSTGQRLSLTHKSTKAYWDRLSRI